MVAAEAVESPFAPPARSGVHISALLPNPEGQDEGNEWVQLKNESSAEVNLIGWKLRDKAGHTVVLTGSIPSGAELKIRLRAGQMPLNNNGDEIELLDAASSIVDKVRYTSGQVVPGRQITPLR